MAIDFKILSRIQSQFSRPLFRVKCRPGDSIESYGVGLRGDRRPSVVLVRWNQNQAVIGRLRDVLVSDARAAVPVPSINIDYNGKIAAIAYSDEIAKKIQNEMVKRKSLGLFTLSTIFSPNCRAVAQQLEKQPWRLALVEGEYLSPEFNHHHDVCTGAEQDETVKINLHGLIEALDFTNYTGSLPDGLTSYQGSLFITSARHTVFQQAIEAISQDLGLQAQEIRITDLISINPLQASSIAIDAGGAWIDLKHFLVMAGVPLDERRQIASSQSLDPEAFLSGSKALEFLFSRSSSGESRLEFTLSRAPQDDPNGGHSAANRKPN